MNFSEVTRDDPGRNKWKEQETSGSRGSESEGRIGKTTIAINLAHALKRQGKEVLIVDADPQGSARDWSENSADGVCPVSVLTERHFRETCRR